jgi:hypothetical protein
MAIFCLFSTELHIFGHWENANAESTHHLHMCRQSILRQANDFLSDLRQEKHRFSMMFEFQVTD